jgi:3-oxoacyl-[acyl-carrier protein] reductase
MELSISRNLAELTTGSRVTVNAVLPGLDPHRRGPGLRAGSVPRPALRAGRGQVHQREPADVVDRPLIDPQEIADFVAFVCSGKASAINGAALRADGGIVRTVF